MQLTAPRAQPLISRRSVARSLGGSVRVRCLTRIEQLHALRPEWEQLAADCPDSTIFQTWQWVTTWYELFGAGASPRVFVARDRDGRLAGIVPCSLPAVTPLRPRVLYLLGRGKGLTEYADALLRPDCASAAVRAVFDAWHRRRCEWDLVQLPCMPAEGALAREVTRIVPARGYRLHVDPHFGVARPLPPSWDAFYGSLNRNMKKHLKKFGNRLQREGGDARFVVLDQPADLDRALDLFFDLHEQRSRAQSGRLHGNHFAAPERRQFLRVLAGRLSERGQVWPCFLEVDGTPVAAQFCFVQGRTLFPFHSGYDPQWAWHGVMMNLFRQCIALGIERGCDQLDLGLGLDQEKLRWGGEPRPVVNLTLAGPHLRSRAAYALFIGRLRLRAWQARRGGAPESAPAAGAEDEE